jgi:hypothetical protein
VNYSVSKAIRAFAVLVVSNVAYLGVAQAGVITVVIDNFDGTVLASPGSATATLISNPDARIPPITVGPTGGKFAIDLATNVAGEVTLNYGLVPLPTGYSSAKISYLVTFSNIGNDAAAANGFGGANTISVSGAAANSFMALPNAGNPNGVIGTSDFAGGSLTLLFKTPGTRSWDLSIDNLELKIQCNGAADVTYGVTGTGAAPVSGLSAYLTNGAKSCGTVPLPNGLALVAIGLFGLALRRKA